MKIKCPDCKGSGKMPDTGEPCPKCNGTGTMARDEATVSVHMRDTFVMSDEKPRRTTDGYLVTQARTARTGIQIYKGSEVGRPDLERVRVLRRPEEVFSEDTLASMTHRPLTLRHPKDSVNSRNWRDLARGYTGDRAIKDGEFVQVPLVMMDQGMIDAYERGGIKELSWGYTTDLKWGRNTAVIDGVEQEYDVEQTSIRANHLALVPVARGGDKLRVGDGHETEKPKMKIKLKDGFSVEVEDDVAGAVIQRDFDSIIAENKTLKDQLATTTAAASAAKVASDAALDTATKAVQTKDGEIVVLKQQVKDAAITPEKLSALVRDRQEIVDKASTMLPANYVYDDKEVATIRKDAVTAKLGDAAKTLTTDEAISGAFNALTVGVKTKDANGVRLLADAIGRQRPVDTTSKAVVDKAFDDLEKRDNEAWRNPGKVAA